MTDWGIHAIQTNGDTKRPEHRSGLCLRELKTLGPEHARNVCVYGTVGARDVLTLQGADLEAWSMLCVGTEDHVHS